MTALTPAEKNRLDREALDFISGHLSTTAVSPSYTEIADALRLNSKASVKRIIDRLVATGRLRQIPNRARAMEIVHNHSAARTHDVPLVSYPDARLFLWDDEAKALKPMERKA